MCAQGDNHVRHSEKAAIYKPRRDQTYRHLDLRLPISGTLRKLTSVAQAA